MKQKQSDLIQLLSVNNLIPLLVTIISIVIFLIKMQAGTELLEYKIDQLFSKVDKYITSREAASEKMKENTAKRDSQISEIYQELATIKTFIKLPIGR